MGAIRGLCADVIMFPRDTALRSCVLPSGHDKAHTDGERRWTSPAPVRVHLHKPAGGTYCGATVTDRAAEQTAYRSEATCPACLAGLTPVSTVERTGR